MVNPYTELIRSGKLPLNLAYDTVEGQWSAQKIFETPFRFPFTNKQSKSYNNIKRALINRGIKEGEGIFLYKVHGGLLRFKIASKR